MAKKVSDISYIQNLADNDVKRGYLEKIEREEMILYTEKNKNVPGGAIALVLEPEKDLAHFVRYPSVENEDREEVKDPMQMRFLSTYSAMRLRERYEMSKKDSSTNVLRQGSSNIKIYDGAYADVYGHRKAKRRKEPFNYDDIERFKTALKIRQIIFGTKPESVNK